MGDSKLVIRKTDSYAVIDELAFFDNLYAESGSRYKMNPSFYKIISPFRMDTEVDSLIRNGSSKRRKRKASNALPMDGIEGWLETCSLVEQCYEKMRTESTHCFEKLVSGDHDLKNIEARASTSAADIVPFVTIGFYIASENDSSICSFYLNEEEIKLEDVPSECTLWSNSSCKIASLAFKEEKFIVLPKSSFLLGDVRLSRHLLSRGLTFDLIVLDPPWSNKSVKRKSPYSTFENAELLTLRLSELLEDDGLVILWVTNNVRVRAFISNFCERHNLRQLAIWHWLKVTTSGEKVYNFRPHHKVPFESFVIACKDFASLKKKDFPDDYVIVGKRVQSYFAMFRKPFTVKSNTNMRNSARRKLLACLNNAEAIPSKAQAAQAVIVCASGDVVNVYTFEKLPYFFDLGDGNIYPTVYYAWISPDSYPTLLIPEQVYSFLENGADLMLPGVIRRTGHFPEFRKQYPVCISVVTKDGSIKGPLAVGISLMSSMEMIANGMQGRGVKILHLYRDYLWDFGSRLHPPSVPVDIRINASLTEMDFPPLGTLSVAERKNVEEDSFVGPVLEDEYKNKQTSDVEDEECHETDVPELPEDLLTRCFLAALKFRVSKEELPIDVGEFYLKYLLPCVPSGKRIDMKKTKYKKFTAFLKEVNSLESSPLIRIEEKKKGAETISEINYSHPMLKNFERTNEITEEQQSAAKPQTKVEELYALTEPVMSLFRSVANVTKGDLLSMAESRRLITLYIKTKELNEKNGRVSMNDIILASLIPHNEETMKWDVLLQKILAKMTKTYVIRTVDGAVLKYKLKLPEITFKVESRSGNKKVTLLNNVIAFGLEPKSLCQKIQIGVATSASIVNDAPQCEGPQIVIQGNQIRFLSNLLTEEYGIDKKYMTGLDLAPKKKR